MSSPTPLPPTGGNSARDRASADGLSGYAEHFSEPEGYLDFARFGPPSHDVVDTVHRLIAGSAAADDTTVDTLMLEETRAREAAARLLGLPASALDQVVLLPNTSTGLFHAALGLPSGKVLVSPTDFPANIYPWRRTEALGRATPQWLPPTPDGRTTPDLIRAALTPETVAVSLSAVDFRTGHRADLAAIREVIGPDRLLVVDAIQGFGVTDLPWQAADVLVTGGQKWLRAGWSTGFLYTSPAAVERLEPVLSGWTGVTDPALFDDIEHPAAPGALRHSITNHNPVAAAGLARALELVEHAGVARIAAQIERRTAELTDTLRAVGATVLSPTEPGERAGILTFTVPGADPTALGKTLAAHAITATTRPQHIRLAVHASTTTATINRLRTALTDHPAGGRPSS
jgi:selenocysteine lyase/cysteine desulfurase